jgi:hypothetical protein
MKTGERYTRLHGTTLPNQKEREGLASEICTSLTKHFLHVRRGVLSKTPTASALEF